MTAGLDEVRQSSKRDYLEGIVPVMLANFLGSLP